MFNFKSLFVLFLFKARFFKLIEEIEESWEKKKRKEKKRKTTSFYPTDTCLILLCYF